MKFEEYMESKEYEKDLSKRIIKKYSPISEKILVLNNLFNASLKKDAYDVEYVDYTLYDIMLNMARIIIYTDIDISDAIKEGTVLDVYDGFKEHDIFNRLDKLVGNDVLELELAMDNILRTYKESKMSTEHFVAKNIVKFGTVFGSAVGNGLDKLADAVRDDVAMKKLVKHVEKMTDSVGKLFKER